jgi:acid phosphatase type 7
MTALSMRSRSFCFTVSTIAVVLVLSVSSAVRAQDLVGLYLTWQQDPTTTMTINWVNLYPGSSNELWYRESGEEKWQRTKARHMVIRPSSLQRRHVELTELEPDTLYEFAIGRRPEKPQEAWTFRTMPAELNRPIRFVTGGDMMHTRAMLDAMSQHLPALEPDFAMFGGDLAYEDGANATRIVDFLQSWRVHGMTKDRRLVPVVAVIGNHEVRGGYGGKVPDDAPYFYGLFSLPQDRAFYALDFGKYLSLIALDSGHTNPVTGEQTTWLEKALEARAEQRFVFPCYHFPAYGTTKAPEGKQPIDSARAVVIRENWVPLFDRFGVTAVFENDHHNYKRTHPLRNDRREDENGIVYLGDGAWGVRTRTVPAPGEAWWLARAEPRNHFWIVDLDPDSPVRVRAMDPTGEVFDDLTLPRDRTEPMQAHSAEAAEEQS